MERVCVIGCGDRGRVHARAWSEQADANVVAVCDVLPERVAALAAEVGASQYLDWREAIDHSGADVVSVCVPTSLHAQIACFAAERGMHVLGEKPLALTVDEGERMIRVARTRGVVYMPCFQYRDDPLNQELRRAFLEGVFGGPVTFRFSDVREVRPKTVMHSRSVNGGVVIDMACHIFDLMRWITGTEPVRLYAAGHVFGRGKPRLSGIQDLAIDEASIELTMAGGHHLQMYLNWGMPEGFPATSPEYCMLGPALVMRYRPGPQAALEIQSGPETRMESLSPGVGTAVRVDRMVRAIRGEADPDVTGEDALIALKLSYAALESIESGKAVELARTESPRT